jgi:hypothetical protein
VVGDNETIALPQEHRPAVPQFERQVAVHDMQDMTAIAPMVGEVTGLVLHESQTQARELERLRKAARDHSRLRNPGRLAEAGDDQRRRGKDHSGSMGQELAEKGAVSLRRIDGENELALDLARAEPIQHRARLFEREDVLDMDFRHRQVKGALI